MIGSRVSARRGNAYKNDIDQKNRLAIANEYIYALKRTTTRHHRHGDPHWGNSLVNGYIKKSGYLIEHLGSRRLIVLVDFGTSSFTTATESEKRHWRIVEREVQRLLQPLAFYVEAKRRLDARYDIRVGDPLRLAYYDELHWALYRELTGRSHEEFGERIARALEDLEHEAKLGWPYRLD